MKDLVNEPVVLKADERYFNSRLFVSDSSTETSVFNFLSERVCRLLLPSQAAEVFGPSGGLVVPLSSHSKPNLKQSRTVYRLRDFKVWGVYAACLKAFCNHVRPGFGERILQIPLKSFDPHPKTNVKTFPERSRRPWVEGCWVDCFVGS